MRFDAIELTLSVRSFHVPETPCTLGLPTQLPLGADLLRDAGNLRGERPELIDHRVDRVLELEHLATHVDGDLLREVAVRDGCRDLRDVPDLIREVPGEDIHVVREVLPGAGHPFYLRLTAELPFGADLLRDARHLAGERAELLDHDVDRVLQLEDLSARLDGDLCDRSPFATAVVTFAMFRTWSVRFPARTFTLSVRSFHVPETP